MAMPLRFQYKGAVYHVSHCGNGREEILKNGIDRKIFINFLEESLKIYNVILYCYVLMEKIEGRLSIVKI